MIVSAPKDRQRLKLLLRPDDRVFLIGCGSCATVCKVGGGGRGLRHAGMAGDAGP